MENNGIKYRFLNEEGRVQDINKVDTIYLSAPEPRVIGGVIETCLRFRNEHFYCQTYYCQPIVEKDDEEVFRATRIINYINAHLCYECDTLYDHSLALDEDKGDIYSGTLIRNEMLEEYFFETMSYILDFQVQFLRDICVPIIGYVAKQLGFFQAAKVGIDHELMGKPIPYIDD